MRAARRLRVLVAEDNPVNQKLAQHSARAARPHADPRRQRPRSGRDDSARPVRPGADGSADAGDGRLRGDRGDSRARARIGNPAGAIIALTAHAMQGDRQRCLDADMDGYVAKPIKPVELFEVIDRVIAAVAAVV